MPRPSPAHFTFVVLVCVLVSGCFSKMRERRLERLAAERDPFSELNLQRYADELIGLVEEEAGRPFVTRPTVSWLEGEEFQQLVEDETREMLGIVFPDTTEAYRELQAERTRHSMGGLLGKYTPANHGVYVLKPRDVDGAVDVLKLVLAHELVHALQNEAIPLMEALEKVHDEDAFDALRAVEEGHATWVEERIAERLELRDAHRRMTRGQGWEPGGELANPRAFSIWALYGQGRNFVQHHHEQGGVDRLWTLIEQPPTTTAMIFRPETYSPARPEDDGLSAVLKGKMELLTRGREWSTIDTTLGEMTLRGEAIRTDIDALEEILEHLVAARQLQGMLPDRNANIRVLRFDDATWPVQYLDLLRRENLTATQELAAAAGVPIQIQLLPFEMEGVAFDDALLRIERVPLGGGRSRQAEVVWAAKGDVCVVVEVDFRAGLRKGWALKAIFDELAESEQP